MEKYYELFGKNLGQWRKYQKYLKYLNSHLTMTNIVGFLSDLLCTFSIVHALFTKHFHGNHQIARSVCVYAIQLGVLKLVPA